MKKKHICVLSGKRGGFGAMTPTMKEIAKLPDTRMSVVVTDQHLYERFGKTIGEVEGVFQVSAAVDMEQRGDSNADRARAIGVGLTKMSDVLNELAPDILLVIGDRGEVFAGCIAAHNLRIAIAHVQGGDISGSLDEPVRHAITKLAHIHFPSTEASKERIIKMGEEPWRVHAVGDTHIDQIFLGSKTSPETLKERYGVTADEPFMLVLQHSDSTDPTNSHTHMMETLEAVLSFGIKALVVYPCSDQGYEGIMAEIDKRRGHPHLHIYPNIPAGDFIGLQSIARCMVGNSSAGLIETPYFGLPAVNVGYRQIGRERASNVIDVPYDRIVIRAAIDKALHDEAFRKACREVKPPFGDGTAYKRIAEVLAEIDVDEKMLNKRMSY